MRKKRLEKLPKVESEGQAPDLAVAEDEDAASEAESKPASLAELQEALAEAEAKYLRAKADRENHRKRMQRELTEARQYVKAYTVQEFLAVFDSFQMALAHADDSAEFETLKQGLQMIDTEFKRTLENLGAARVEAAGKTFDPNEHEAISQEPSEDVPEGGVIRQWKCGFRLGERLLRPAAVVVSSGPSNAEDDEKKAE